MVTVTSKSNYKFALRRYVLAEIALDPYIMLRGNLAHALMRDEPGNVMYAVGDTAGIYHAEVRRLPDGELAIGCQTFSRTDAERIIAWATGE